MSQPTQIPEPLPRTAVGGMEHATWLLDGVVTSLLFLFTVLPEVLFGVSRTGSYELVQMSVVVLLDTALVAATLLRRRRPMLTLGTTVALCLAHLWWLAFPTLSLVTVLLVAYSVARWVPGRRSRIVLVMGLAGSLLGPTRWLLARGTWQYDGFPWGVLLLASASCFGLVTACYAIGRRIREAALADEERLLAEARRRQMELAEREQQARLADSATRTQIARELHDIVAHSLSVMVVQAEGGRALATKRPEQAAQVLDTIAETGREALTEMRRIVGVLRDGSDEDAYAPAPGLAQIPELVARSGVDAELVVDGEAPAVSSVLGLTVYRVVQEALTNVLKHAGPGAHARVRLGFTPRLIVAEVTDDGRATTTSDGMGHGLQGMRERVGSMHGHLEAHPGEAGGFCVRAVLPIPERPDPQPAQELR